jgi:glycosyltransferase involved in cell wall biosynthesis
MGPSRNESALGDLVTRTRGLGIEHQFVHAEGRSDEETQAIIGLSDIFVQPSHFEGSSLTLEAMVHGRAAVGSAVGGIPDKIQNGISGLLVQSGRVDLLAAAIARLASDDAMRMVLRKRATVESERFSTDALLPQYLGLYARRPQAAAEALFPTEDEI